MTTTIKLLRSSTKAVRPRPTDLAEGTPMVNYNAEDGGLYFRLSNDSLGKVGTPHYGAVAPNTSAAGSSGNVSGELWVDTTTSAAPELKFYDSTASSWVSVNNPYLTLAELTVIGETNLCTDGSSTLTVSGPTILEESVTFGATVTPSTTDSFSLGTQAKRFLKVYALDVFTGDLHLNNESRGGNDVDGTTGSWTLQEGADNLYIINNITGNKFKVSMEPV